MQWHQAGKYEQMIHSVFISILHDKVNPKEVKKVLKKDRPDAERLRTERNKQAPSFTFKAKGLHNQWMNFLSSRQSQSWMWSSQHGKFWICPRICFECRFEHYPTLHLWSSRLVLSQTFQRPCLKTFLYAKCPRPGGRYWVRNSGRFLLGLRDRMTFLFWSHMLKLTLRPLDIQAWKSSSWWGSQLINATLAAYPIMWAWLTWCELLIETSAWLLHCQALGCMAGNAMHVRSIAAAFCCAFQACVWSASWRPFLGNKWQEAGKVLPATWPFVARRWPSASWPLWQTRGMLSNYNQESEFSVRQSFSNSVFPKGCGHEEVWCLLRKKSGLKCEICHHHFDFEAIYCDHVWTYHDLPTSNKVTNHSLGVMREWLNGPAGPTWPASIYSPVRFLGGKSWPNFTIQIMSCKHVLLLIHDLNVEVLEHLELKLPWVGTVLCAHNGAIGGLRSCDENRRWRNQSRAQSQISKGFDLGGISESGILSLLISE